MTDRLNKSRKPILIAFDFSVEQYLEKVGNQGEKQHKHVCSHAHMYTHLNNAPLPVKPIYFWKSFHFLKSTNVFRKIPHKALKTSQTI